MKENGFPFERRKVKPLILFEDVDITFLEDRGFVAAMEQIADTAKGPLVLTTNSKCHSHHFKILFISLYVGSKASCFTLDSNIALPDSLDRLEMSFAMPSIEELVHHVYMVHPSIYSLKKFIFFLPLVSSYI